MTELPPAAFANLVSVYDGWFHYPVRVHPHHTDYAGVVWHGSYITWMEAARVECLRAVGVGYEELVASGLELPVVAMSLRYHQSVKMGENIDVKTKLAQLEKLRLNWDYEIRTQTQLCVTGSVSLVTLEKGKIVRTLPPVMENAIARLIDMTAEKGS